MVSKLSALKNLIRSINYYNIKKYTYKYAYKYTYKIMI